MDYKYTNFVIVKIIDLLKGKQGIAYLCWTMTYLMKIRHRLTLMPNDMKLVFRIKNQLLWVKKITDEDYATISFVLDEYVDDHLYCFTVFDQYFKNHALDINRKDILDQLN